MKVYIVYESYYGELIQETGDSTQIIGIYSNLEKAKEEINNRVQADLGDDYVLDDETENIINENGGYFRLFYNNQENWACYYEVVAEVREVE